MCCAHKHQCDGRTVQAGVSEAQLADVRDQVEGELDEQCKMLIPGPLNDIDTDAES